MLYQLIRNKNNTSKYLNFLLNNTSTNRRPYIKIKVNGLSQIKLSHGHLSIHFSYDRNLYIILIIIKIHSV